MSRHFELINYSEFGSIVNGVMYACDVTGSAAPPPAVEDETEARAAALRDIVRDRMPKPQR